MGLNTEFLPTVYPVKSDVIVVNNSLRGYSLICTNIIWNCALIINILIENIFIVTYTTLA